MTEDRSPLTPQQIREELRAWIAHREAPAVIEFALSLFDSQALALTQAQRDLEILRARQLQDVTLKAEVEALTAERDALKEAMICHRHLACPVHFCANCGNYVEAKALKEIDTHADER